MSPRLLEIALAGLSVDRALREAIIGDLLEERSELAAARGDRVADWWMFGQVVRSLPLLAHTAVARAGGARATARILVSAFAALVAVLAVASGSAALAFGALTPHTIARLALLFLVLDLGFGVVGGYLAARLGRVAPLASAAALGLMAVLLTLASTGESMQAWYALALQVLLVPAALLGGWLRARQLAGRS